MLDPKPPVFLPDKYDDHGKWMDGWETRRRRQGGHDQAIIALATQGHVQAVDIDTSHFTGNYAPAARLEGWCGEGDPPADAPWTEILPPQPLRGNSPNPFACAVPGPWSHLRLSIYPDGGVARLRVYGQPVLRPPADPSEPLDLASALNGGRVLAVSDAHYGSYTQILAPGRGADMGDGWETRRRRAPGFDWMIVQLGARATLRAALVDTCHYKGNFPHSCSLHAGDLSGMAGAESVDAVTAAAMFWPVLMPDQVLGPDAEHRFGGEVIQPLGPVTHVRLNIFPDGGISRLRLFGVLA